MISASTRFFLVMLVAASAFSCTRSPDEATVAAHAKAALGPYKTALKNELGAALTNGGAEAAVDTCALRAPALGTEHSKDGVRVGRASPKLRSPASAPPTWLVPVMNDLSKAPTGSTDGRVVRIGEDRWGYAEPIHIQKPCLTCHGDSIAPPVEEKIRAHYPADAAKGYQLGEFRGVFYAELDKEAFKH